MNGICYVAYGHSARVEAAESIKSLREHCDLPVAVISDKPLRAPGIAHVYAPDADPGGRLAKLSLDQLSPFDATLYLDADTRVHGDISTGFGILGDGWDVAIATSTRQGDDVLGNCYEADRQATFEILGCRDVLALQAGVMFFRRCEAVAISIPATCFSTTLLIPISLPPSTTTKRAKRAVSWRSDLTKQKMTIALTTS